MSTEVRHFPPFGFFTVSTYQPEVRYFNGRKFKVYRRMEHYIHPRAHRSDFTHYTVFVHYEAAKWRTEIMRYSETTF